MNNKQCQSDTVITYYICMTRLSIFVITVIENKEFENIKNSKIAFKNRNWDYFQKKRNFEEERERETIL